MVLEYLSTKLGDLWGFYVGKYTSTMEHMGYRTLNLQQKLLGLRRGHHLWIARDDDLRHGVAGRLIHLAETMVETVVETQGGFRISVDFTVRTMK